ncbi:MAG: hypothetical protein KDB04_04555 [Acidimicrobiales bacterium]|nr:hypothetical protein [Acidimicrobiales bacterium]HRW36695.1 hypothetical protein [Aquihabitans sp.]
MLTLHRHHDDRADESWSDGHAAPEDRALGLELELIELHRRRDELSPDHPEVARVDREVQAVIDELVAVTAELAPSPPAHLAA